LEVHEMRKLSALLMVFALAACGGQSEEGMMDLRRPE
jgi:hypothetical protein